jgi:hypothetical protein
VVTGQEACHHKGWVVARLNFEFRAELFNIFNLPNFSLPSGDINSTGFGVLTGMIGNARQIQFNGRINF